MSGLYFYVYLRPLLFYAQSLFIYRFQQDTSIKERTFKEKYESCQYKGSDKVAFTATKKYHLFMFTKLNALKDFQMEVPPVRFLRVKWTNDWIYKSQQRLQYHI